MNGRPGTHFFVKYRIKGATSWWHTNHELDEDFTIIRALSPDETYEIIVVSVDGDYMTESELQEIQSTENNLSVLNLSTGNGTCKMFYSQ